MSPRFFIADEEGFFFIYARSTSHTMHIHASTLVYSIDFARYSVPRRHLRCRRDFLSRMKKGSSSFMLVPRAIRCIYMHLLWFIQLTLLGTPYLDDIYDVA